MPVTIFKGNEASAANTSDGLRAGSAALSKELSEAFGTVGLLVLGGEPLTSKRLVTVGTSEALAMPRVVLVSHTARRDDLGAFNATSCKLLFVASGTVNVLFTRDERLCANRRLADAAAEAFLVPLPTLVLHLLGSSAENFATAVTSSGVHRVVARTAEDLLGLGSELLVD